MSDDMSTGIGLTVGELLEVARKWLLAGDPMLRILMGQSAQLCYVQTDYTSTVKEELRSLHRAMAEAAEVQIAFSDEKGFVREGSGSSFSPRYNAGERGCMIKGAGYDVAVFQKMVEILRERNSVMRQQMLNPPAPDTEYEGYEFPNQEPYNTALAEVSAEMGVPYHRVHSGSDVTHVGPTDKLEEFLAKVYLRSLELRNLAIRL